MTGHKRRRAIKLSRDTLLFIIGIAGIAHETLINNSERPSLLILFAGMVGLPAFLGDKKESDDDPKAPQ